MNETEVPLIEALEEELAGLYRWYAQEAPGVTPREEGRIAYLWSRLDDLYRIRSQSGMRL